MDLIQNRHEFINNSLRLEILNKMICEELEKNQAPNPEYLKDLEKFLKEHISFLEEN